MCASLHKAQLLGGVRVEVGKVTASGQRGPGQAVLGASGSLGVHNLNLNCPCWAPNMAITSSTAGQSWPCALCSTCLVPVFQQGCVTSHRFVSELLCW